MNGQGPARVTFAMQAENEYLIGAHRKNCARREKDAQNQAPPKSEPLQITARLPSPLPQPMDVDMEVIPQPNLRSSRVSVALQENIQVHRWGHRARVEVDGSSDEDSGEGDGAPTDSSDEFDFGGDSSPSSDDEDSAEDPTGLSSWDSLGEGFEREAHLTGESGISFKNCAHTEFTLEVRDNCM